MSDRHPPDDVARVARLYTSNADAAGPLGITPRSFARLCQQYGIETPYGRKRRRTQEARRPRATRGLAHR